MSIYTNGARGLQDQFDTRRLADRIEKHLVRAELGEEDRAFIERMDMFFLATVDARGWPSCSYKGGAPGFVRVLDPTTIAFPSYNGNGMFLSMGHIARPARTRQEDACAPQERGPGTNYVSTGLPGGSTGRPWTLLPLDLV